MEQGCLLPYADDRLPEEPFFAHEVVVTQFREVRPPPRLFLDERDNGEQMFVGEVVAVTDAVPKPLGVDPPVVFGLSVASDPLIPLISEVPSHPEVDGAGAFLAAQRDALGYVGALWIAQRAGRASIGYSVHSANRREGVTSEAVRAASDWLLTEGGVERLEAFVEPWNVGSIRVAEHAGFEREGLMKAFAPLIGQRRYAYLFARIA